MNQTTRYVMDIYQIGVIIRDTFEYLITKDEYNINAYNQRKAMLANCLNQGHPFNKFLSENGENGEKIRNNIKDFYDMVYGEEAHAVFLENGKIITDAGYTNQIIDYVVGLHETIYDVCNGFMNYAKENNTAEAEFEDLMKKENEYYRCLAGLIITDKIHGLFVEFNKAMRENKGQPSPQSNFISNDLKKCIGFFKFTEEHANYEDDIYKLAVEKTKRVVDLMGGKEKLDDTGEGLRKEIMALHELWVKTVALTENPWKNAYAREVQAIIDFDKQIREAAQNNQKEEAPAAEVSSEQAN